MILCSVPWNDMNKKPVHIMIVELTGMSGAAVIVMHYSIFLCLVWDIWKSSVVSCWKDIMPYYWVHPRKNVMTSNYQSSSIKKTPLSYSYQNNNNRWNSLVCCKEKNEINKVHWANNEVDIKQLKMITDCLYDQGSYTDLVTWKYLTHHHHHHHEGARLTNVGNLDSFHIS